LITGTGRSGTSTMSGTLFHLGLTVPGPYLGANDSNPKGFFEARWSVKFHKRLQAAAGIEDFDGNPAAFGRAQAAITDEIRAELVAWLRRWDGEEQVVVKDPRSVWAQRLWHDAAAEVGRDIRYLSMLRHPAEVIGSRSTHYVSNDANRSRYETFTTGRWINNSVISERETRGHVRAFVKYTDLLEDWRPVAARLRDELGLTYNTDLSRDEHHAVDEFIEPSLRRHGISWDGLSVPQRLIDLAEAVWADVVALGEHGGVDEAASADLDACGERYGQIFWESAAIAHDAVAHAKVDTRRQVEREARESVSAPSGPSVAEVGGRELLREVGRRVSQRLLRRGDGSTHV
jgi:hypothetical protein